jgi:hypothetical protein
VKSSTQLCCPSSPSKRKAVCDFGGFEQSAKIGREPLSHGHVGRRLKRADAEHIGQALELRLISVEPVGIAGGELGDFGFGAPGAPFR